MKNKFSLLYLFLIPILALSCSGGLCGDDPIFNPDLFVKVNLVDSSGYSIFNSNFALEELEILRVRGQSSAPVNIQEDSLFSIDATVGFLTIDTLFGYEYHLKLSDTDTDTLTIFIQSEEDSGNCPFKNVIETRVAYNGVVFLTDVSPSLSHNVSCINLRATLQAPFYS